MNKLVRSICIVLLAIFAHQKGLMAQKYSPYYYISNVECTQFLFCWLAPGYSIPVKFEENLITDDDRFLWRFVTDGDITFLECKAKPGFVLNHKCDLVPKDREVHSNASPMIVDLKETQQGIYHLLGYTLENKESAKKPQSEFFAYVNEKGGYLSFIQNEADALPLIFISQSSVAEQEPQLPPGHYAITIPSVPVLNADSLKKVAAELKKTDDVEFDSKGYLVKFKKTCDDASYVVYEGKTSPSYADHIRYIKFYTSDGGVFDGLCSDLRLKDIYNMTSYNKFWEGLKGVRMMTKPESNIYSTFTLPDGSRVTYNEHVGIYKYYQPINEKGDFCEYQVDPIYSFDLQSAKSGIIDNFRRSYDQAIVTIKPRYDVTQLQIPASIHYKNGDVYEGKLTVPDEAFFKDKSNSYVHYYNASWWEDPKLLEKISLHEGRMTHSDGSFHIYVNNQIDEFETMRVIKKEEAKKKEEQAALALQSELIKKYGKANVEAFAKGVVIIGMPQELFLLGIRARQFLLEQSVEVAYQNGKNVTYYVYGFKANSNTITDHGYLGRLHFIDGKLYSKTY